MKRREKSSLSKARSKVTRAVSSQASICAAGSRRARSARWRAARDSRCEISSLSTKDGSRREAQRVSAEEPPYPSVPTFLQSAHGPLPAQKGMVQDDYPRGPRHSGFSLRRDCPRNRVGCLCTPRLAELAFTGSTASLGHGHGPDHSGRSSTVADRPPIDGGYWRVPVQVPAQGRVWYRCPTGPVGFRLMVAALRLRLRGIIRTARSFCRPGTMSAVCSCP
jgi:hypothetical protein